MRRKLDETRRSHRLKEQALRLKGSLLMGVAAAAAGGDVATAWKAVGGLFALLCFASASHFSFGLLAVVRPSPRIARDDDTSIAIIL